MTTYATATFTAKRWAQKTCEGRPANEVTGSKLTHEVAAYQYGEHCGRKHHSAPHGLLRGGYGQLYRVGAD